MKPEEIAAYIGAAAWLPQIASWLYHQYITPRVTIIPNRSVEIGFTRLGPIVNLNMAFSSERRDAIVTDLLAILKHEDGDEHTFRWAGMSETFSEITDSTGNRQVVSKDQTPIAFKIGTDILFEKFVRFQEPRFREITTQPDNNLLAHFKYLKEANPDFVQATLQSKEFRDSVKAHQQAFWWKPGKYLVDFRLSSPRKLVLKKHLSYFILNQTDIDELKQNILTVEKDTTETVKSNTPGYVMQPISWNWCYPIFVPKK